MIVSIWTATHSSVQLALRTWCRNCGAPAGADCRSDRDRRIPRIWPHVGRLGHARREADFRASIREALLSPTPPMQPVPDVPTGTGDTP